jgi:hypothetical protein
MGDMSMTSLLSLPRLIYSRVASLSSFTETSPLIEWVYGRRADWAKGVPP